MTFSQWLRHCDRPECQPDLRCYPHHFLQQWSWFSRRRDPDQTDCGRRSHRNDRAVVSNRNGSGIVADTSGGAAGINLTVKDSTINGNVASGILATTTGGGIGIMSMRNSFVANGTALATSGANSTIRVGDSLLTGNGTAGSGNVLSFGTSQVEGNGNNGTLTLIPAPALRQGVFKPKPAPDLIRAGNRFRPRNRVKSRLWSPPFRIYRNGLFAAVFFLQAAGSRIRRGHGLLITCGPFCGRRDRYL